VFGATEATVRIMRLTHAIAVGGGLAIAVVTATPSLSALPQRDSQPAAVRCEGLLKAVVAGQAALVLASAALNPPSAAQPAPNPFAPPTPALPEHCQVAGALNERTGVNGQHYAIRFQLRLPTTWNGRFFFQGGGGSNGNVAPALGGLQGQQPNVALALGYAVVSQDSGHDNMMNSDPARGGTQTFGFDPQARSDFGYSSYHVVTVTAKALVARYYGRAPEKSYYVGCSEGGREALMISQRYPDDYDGILACSPGLRLARAAVAEAWDSQAIASVAKGSGQLDSSGQPLLGKAFSDADLALVSGAVLNACDALDGLADGIVGNFPGCTTSVVTPKLDAITCAGDKTDACLSRAQVAALVRVFDGARTSTGERVYTPWAWDAGIGGKLGAAFNQGWRVWKMGAFNAPANSAINVTLGATALSTIFITPPVPVQTGPAAVAFALGFDIDSAPRLLAATTSTYRESALEFMKADSSDLSAFKRHGGRLVVAHGVSDPVFSVLDTVDWWSSVDRAEGGRAKEFARFFPVPGMNHCAGGPATDQFDAFGALVRWVEQGTAPDSIVATARDGTPWPGRTRPLCPYPLQARYSGTGSIEKAENFVCR
jgi:poly(3-hydroxybutyrate) depolymerase